MAFINQYISEADVRKFGLKAIDKHRIVDGTNARHWTIDRQRNIYLRNVGNNHEEGQGRSEWTLFWKGTLIFLELRLLGGGGLRGEPGWSHWMVRHIGIPLQLEKDRKEILADLRDALTAYKDAGVFSVNTSYAVILSF